METQPLLAFCRDRSPRPSPRALRLVMTRRILAAMIEISALGIMGWIACHGLQ